MIKIRPTDKFNKTLDKVIAKLKSASEDIDSLKIFLDKKHNGDLPEHVVRKMNYFENLQSELFKLRDGIHYLS